MTRAQPHLVAKYAEWPPKGRKPDSDATARANKTPQVTSNDPRKEPASASKTAPKATNEVKKATTDSKTMDEAARKHGKMSTWNGAETDKYRWSQSISDITFEIDLPSKTKAKEIDVKVTKDFDMTIKAKGEVILDGTLDVHFITTTTQNKVNVLCQVVNFCFCINRDRYYPVRRYGRWNATSSSTLR